MSELSPTQVALRELMILTRCYCDGEHPRLGHNCSFRRDVQTVVAAVGDVLKLCDTVTGPGELPADAVWKFSKAIRAAVLGLPPWSEGNGNATSDVSDGEGGASAPG